MAKIESVDTVFQDAMELGVETVVIVGLATFCVIVGVIFWSVVAIISLWS